MPVSPIRASKPHAGRLVPLSSPTIAEASRLNTDALFSRLEASPQGLTRREAAARLARFGENAVATERRIAPMHRLLQLFASPLSALLLVLAVVSALTGEARGAAAIAAMVVLSVLLSWYQEYRSGDAAERLRALVHTTATVMRRDRRDAPSAG